MRLLINLFLYLSGIMIGFFVKNYGLLVFLLIIPNIVVYYILDKKQRRIEEFIRKYKNGEFNIKNNSNGK